MKTDAQADICALCGCDNGARRGCTVVACKHSQSCRPRASLRRRSAATAAVKSRFSWITSRLKGPASPCMLSMRSVVVDKPFPPPPTLQHRAAELRKQRICQVRFLSVSSFQAKSFARSGQRSGTEGRGVGSGLETTKSNHAQ